MRNPQIPEATAWRHQGGIPSANRGRVHVVMLLSARVDLFKPARVDRRVAIEEQMEILSQLVKEGRRSYALTSTKNPNL